MIGKGIETILFTIVIRGIETPLLIILNMLKIFGVKVGTNQIIVCLFLKWQTLTTFLWQNM